MDMESNVVYYYRNFPIIFDRALKSTVYSNDGVEYTDFLSCCGALNYGHNDPKLKSHLIDYIKRDGITSSLDLRTTARDRFIASFEKHVLRSRSLDYKIQFTNPTGTNAVEAALKLARKVTGRSGIVSFTNAFHGCSLGALAATGNSHHRSSSDALLNQTFRMPFDGYLGSDVNSADLLYKLLSDPSSGVSRPAAIIFEPVQGEGGLNVAGKEWARALQGIAKEFGVVLIADEIQTGCGRIGTFFAFEQLDIVPDMVLLAKSLSGYGLPMAVNLLRPDLDAWEPGEHNGTFRGNNLAFVTATAAIEAYWQDGRFERSIVAKAAYLDRRLCEIAAGRRIEPCGKGLMRGLRFANADLAEQARNGCFERRLIMETCGPFGEVLKINPPLNIEQSQLSDAIDCVEQEITCMFQREKSKRMSA